MEALPIPSRTPRSSINDQLFRLLGHFGIQIVHQHPQSRFLLPALAGNLRPSRRAKWSLCQSDLGLLARCRHAHEFPSPSLILTHAPPFCIRSHSQHLCVVDLPGTAKPDGGWSIREPRVAIHPTLFTLQRELCSAIGPLDQLHGGASMAQPIANQPSSTAGKRRSRRLASEGIRKSLPPPNGVTRRHGQLSVSRVP